MVTSAARWSLRVATAPWVRASAAASEVASELVAVVTSASAGRGVANAALPVIDWTIARARLMRAGTGPGSLSATMLRGADLVAGLVVVVVVVMVVPPGLRASRSDVRFYPWAKRGGFWIGTHGT